MDDPRNVFREEAEELLAELETSLLELEDRPTDQDLIGRVFRAMHTIKGSGAMFGFNDIAAFTHEVETIYDQVREGEMSVDSQLVNLSLAARDQIRAMLEAAFAGTAVDREQNEKILAGLAMLKKSTPADRTVEGASTSDKEKGRSRSFDPEPEPSPRTYQIHFAPKRDFFQNGSNPLPLLDELRQLGTCEVTAHSEAIPDLASIDPAASYLTWDINLTTDQEINAILDVFIFVEDLCRLEITPAADLSQEIAAKHQTPQSAETEATPVPPGAMAPASKPPERDKPSATSAGTQANRAPRSAPPAASIRVDAVRLDRLVNQVGELVTVQARLSRLANQNDDQELLAVAEELEMLTGELRDNTMGVRMMPIGTIFNKFRRLVRDLSQKLDKEVILITEGEETELDKTVIEKLNDPFVHLVRNCVDHGIEKPATRSMAGKPNQGTVRLSALHSGDSVLIEIADDGAGLDRETLRRKAVEKGLLASDAEPGDQEIYQLLFLPGFSTATAISDVSGRGVGMDVVKRGIESLRGNITITSESGEGTTVRIRLPLTLAIIESLLVKIGDQDFVLPLGLVEECIELRQTRNGQGGTQGDRDLVNVRGHLVPYIPLRKKFAIPGTPPELQQVVITRLNGEKIGFVVDHVVGEHQTVIKSLGPLYRDVKGFSGATILGDGSLALIIDLPELTAGGPITTDS